MGPFLLRGEEGGPSRFLYGDGYGFSRLAEEMRPGKGDLSYGRGVEG
jgi:hypothetical protein